VSAGKATEVSRADRNTTTAMKLKELSVLERIPNGTSHLESGFEFTDQRIHICS
jgi:hypothetical protein